MDESFGPEIVRHVEEATQYLLSLLPTPLHRPPIGIICGSGLGGLADGAHADSCVEVCYTDIPHFPQSTGIYQPICLTQLFH